MILQQNERQIQPIQTWINGEVKTMEILRLDNYFQYDFLMSPGYVHYCLCSYGEEQQTDIDGNPLTIAMKPTIIDGNIPMTWQLIENWGQDDEPIFAHVLTTLNLTLV